MDTHRSLAFAVALFAFSIPAFATAQTKPDVKGMYLLTDYPAVTVQPGTTSTVNLKLRNYGLAPERLSLSVAGVPKGWTATLLGGGQPIAAAMPATDDSVLLDLRLEVPKDAAIGAQTLTVKADGANTQVALPVEVSLAKELPAKLSLQPQLPELRGSTRSNFEYTMTVKNDSGKKLLVSLAADAPRNFDTAFTEAYGTQELTAIPVDAGKSKDVKLKVTPPDAIDAGHYPVTVRIAAEDAKATAQVALDITGEPKLTLAGREGLLSARATAGQESTVPVTVTNTGTAPADNIELSGGAERLEDLVRAQDNRPHCAQSACRSAGADYAARQGDCRRLRDDAQRLLARRQWQCQLPCHRDDVDHVGRGRAWHHRCGAADHGRRGRPFRAPVRAPP